MYHAIGGGKTELLRALRKHAEAYFLSNLTEKSLVSGYREPRNPTNDPSLLPQLNGKVLVIKDLSPPLSMRRESRDKILVDLRDAYDGFTDQGRGNVGRVSYEAKFSVLAGSTLAIERYDAVEGELGKRFVKFRSRSNESAANVRRAIRNMGRNDSMRAEMEAAVRQFLDSLPPFVALGALDEYEAALTTISDFAAQARSHVPRDQQHNLRYTPRPEVGTRLGKELAKLLLALATVRGKEKPDEEDLRTVARVAEDCLPPNRHAVLRRLRQAQGQQATRQIATGIRLPWSTAKQTLEDLQV